MKIIYLANIRVPTEKAHGLQIMKMCQSFMKSGMKEEKIEVDLVVAKRKNPQFKGIDSFGYYKISERFSIRRLWVLDIVDWQWPWRGFSAVIRNTTFAFSSFFYLLFKSADIIYSRDEFSLFLLGFFKKNLVLELHVFPRTKLFLYKWVFRKVKKIIVINHKLKELIVGLGVNSNKILVAPDGVDLEQFDIEKSKEESRRELGLPRDKKLIIYTGHLFGWKGVYTLAEASQFLSEDYRIAFIGGMKDDRMKLEEFINEKRLGKVMIVEHQPPYLIPLYLKSADVLVLPNSGKKKISRLFTSPIKMFEYMSSGRPIVASDLPSIREILNEKNCFFFQSDSAENLAGQIELALGNQEKPKQALIDVQKYTWQKRAGNILEFIN